MPLPCMNSSYKENIPGHTYRLPFWNHQEPEFRRNALKNCIQYIKPTEIYICKLTNHTILQHNHKTKHHLNKLYFVLKFLSTHFSIFLLPYSTRTCSPTQKPLHKHKAILSPKPKSFTYLHRLRQSLMLNEKLCNKFTFVTFSHVVALPTFVLCHLQSCSIPHFLHITDDVHSDSMEENLLHHRPTLDHDSLLYLQLKSQSLAFPHL